MHTIFYWLSVILMALGFAPYIKAIVKDGAQPKRTSWFIWLLLDLITYSGMVAADSVNGHIRVAVLGALAISILSIKFGKNGWTKIDTLSVIGAALAIGLWKMFDSPTVGLVTSLIATIIAAIPTFESGWKTPEKEDKLGWTLFWLSCIAATIAAESWAPEDSAQPLTFLFIESVMMWLLFVRPWKNTSPQ